MTTRWWLATAQGRQAPSPPESATSEAAAHAACRRGAILVMEAGGAAAVVLDPAWQLDAEEALRAIAASLRAQAQLRLRLPDGDGWYDIAADGPAELLAQAAAWIRLAQPRRWATARFRLAGGEAVPLTPARPERLPPWAIQFVRQPVDGAAGLAARAARHTRVAEALLAGLEATAGSPGPAALRYLDHHGRDDRPPDLTAPPVRDWLIEAHETGHTILARPPDAAAEGEPHILVFPVLYRRLPIPNCMDTGGTEAAIAALMLN